MITEAAQQAMNKLLNDAFPEPKQQTAVEWLIDKLNNYDSEMIELFYKEIAETKEMEKQQIINAYSFSSIVRTKNKAEQYYNETFKKK